MGAEQERENPLQEHFTFPFLSLYRMSPIKSENGLELVKGGQWSKTVQNGEKWL